ncbi:MAG: hypothetical protein ACRC6H_10765, partial [Culicoidibacterales bacterium]
VATEFNIEKLRVGQVVRVRIVNSGTEIQAVITEIVDLPDLNEGDVTTYTFYAQPEQAIRVGFSVELQEIVTILEIPEAYVATDTTGLFVVRQKEDVMEKVNISGEKQDTYYLVEQGTLQVGDVLINNPATVNEVE